MLLDKIYIQLMLERYLFAPNMMCPFWQLEDSQEGRSQPGWQVINNTQYEQDWSFPLFKNIPTPIFKAIFLILPIKLPPLPITYGGAGQTMT